MNLTQVLRKAFLLASVLPKHPLEFCDRVSALLEVNLDRLRLPPGDYKCRKRQEVISSIEQIIDKDVCAYLNEDDCIEIDAKVRKKMEEIAIHAPFSLDHSADLTLASLSYSLCRALKPSIVLETGVAYGVTSAFILKGLEVNAKGFLHSVDLPPLGRNADQFVGILIPEALKDRWYLHRGVSKRVLPALLPQLVQVDVFVHDSLHTYKSILRELQTVAPYLASPAIVIADDIDGNQAFRHYVTQTQPAFWSAIQETEKKSLFGISVFHDAYPSRS